MNSEYADQILHNVLLSKKQKDVSFLLKGKFLSEIQDKKLYKDLEYNSFKEFLEYEDLGFSPPAAKFYIKIYRFYIEEKKFEMDYISNFSSKKLSLLIPELRKLKNIHSIEKRLKETKDYKVTFLLKHIRKNKKSPKPKIHKNKNGIWEVNYYEDKTLLNNLGPYS